MIICSDKTDIRHKAVQHSLLGKRWSDIFCLNFIVDLFDLFLLSFKPQYSHDQKVRKLNHFVAHQLKISTKRLYNRVPFQCLFHISILLIFFSLGYF